MPMNQILSFVLSRCCNAWVMKRIVFLFLLVLPLYVVAQNNAAGFLEKAVVALKSDAAVHMDYEYAVYDSDSILVQEDSGIMRVDGERYVLLMDGMKVWCDGNTQWSYIRDVNEIYVADAASDVAQSLSPLSMMENCLGNCSSVMESSGGKVMVKVAFSDDVTGVSSVVLSFDEGSSRIESMVVSMMNGGRIEVRLKNYAAKCKFDNSLYVCPLADYSGVEIVDMR